MRHQGLSFTAIMVMITRRFEMHPENTPHHIPQHPPRIRLARKLSNPIPIVNFIDDCYCTPTTDLILIVYFSSCNHHGETPKRKTVPVGH